MATLGSTIDKMFQLREFKRSLEQEVKQVTHEIEEVERELLSLMESENVTKSTGARATASISESVKPSVENWDDFYNYIHKMKYYHLLERRPSVSGCRELFETKGSIPGVVPFVQRKISLRTL